MCLLSLSFLTLIEGVRREDTRNSGNDQHNENEVHPGHCGRQNVTAGLVVDLIDVGHNLVVCGCKGVDNRVDRVDQDHRGDHREGTGSHGRKRI